MSGLWLGLGAVVVLASGSASADILEWRDAGGGRHFTNRQDAVPPERRAAAQVLVVERPQPPEEKREPERRPPAERPERAAEVVSDSPAWHAAYAEGVLEGIALAAAGRGAGGGNVEIKGPLAVARAEVTGAPVHALPYFPFVTTSFDRGRSRHLTLRLLLQDQFQLDRDGPFVYQRLPPVGLGPALRPFLPRGLPRSGPRGGRVIFR